MRSATGAIPSVIKVIILHTCTCTCTLGSETQKINVGFSGAIESPMVAIHLSVALTNLSDRAFL